MRFQTLYEGRWIFFVVFVLLALGLWRGWHPLTALAVGLLIFCINFFRDPERVIPPGDHIVVSAADGMVADIVEIEEGEVVKTKCRRVGVFLSVFDVHVNRAPIAGECIYNVEHPGLYLDARDPDCSVKNAARTWAFKGAKATLVVRQITGLIARRIVPWSKQGDTVEKGFRFGMIRFGSRTEVYLPLDAEVKVQIGQKVKGGETVIAELK